MSKRKKNYFSFWSILLGLFLVFVIVLSIIVVKNNQTKDTGSDQNEGSLYGYFQNLTDKEYPFRDVLKSTDEKVVFGEDVIFELMDAYSKNRSYIAKSDLEINKLYSVFYRKKNGQNVAFNIIEIPSVAITGRVKEVADNMIKVVSNGKMYEVKHDEKTIKQEYDGEKYFSYDGDYSELPLVVVSSDNNAFFDDTVITAAHIDVVPYEPI